jgi:hypothetical protein
LTPVQPDGSWSTDITTGGTDQLATRIAALLVPTNYNQSCVNGLAFVPTNVFLQASASAVVTRPSPGPRWLSFSGYDWWLKSSTSPVGPGPNLFSDGSNNVWLDPQGQLHLCITNRSNQWQCAEIVSARSFGCGSYRFELNSRIDNLNPNVVLGLFTWSDDPSYAYREIDVECSRFGNAADINNAQYVVQPYQIAGHLMRFRVPTGLTNSTHSFTWETNRISFQSLSGSYTAAPYPANVISNWTYNLTTPQAGDENVRFNLWLVNGQPPTDNQEVEVILKSFQFVPLGAPLLATLDNLTVPASGQPQCNINVQPDRRYQVQTSSDLTLWQSYATLLATNTPLRFVDSTSLGASQLFYRTVTLP